MKMVLLRHDKWLVLFIFIILLEPCYPSRIAIMDNKATDSLSLPFNIIVNRTITIEHYFQYLDSIVNYYNPLTPYHLTEHLLVRANPWIIDTLKNTDYYLMKARGFFVYDQKKMIVLSKGVHLKLPIAEIAEDLLNSFDRTEIDINIPEFKLRIIQGGNELYCFDVRVGRDEKKYLKMADRIVDLKTKTGRGMIVGYNRFPQYFNPVNGKEYFVTKRDDDKVTLLPQIPFLETEINGVRNGQLIHPTTNPATLLKAYSNGCIGMNESDAWMLYYYAPIGTKINIRYDLKILTDKKAEIILKDIYNVTNIQK